MKIFIILPVILISCQARDLPVNANVNSDITAGDTNVTDIYESGDTEHYADAGGFTEYVCKMYNIQLSENNDNTDIFIPDLANGKYYAVLVLQGSDLPKENYRIISNKICSYGFVVAVFDHYKDSFSGKHLYAEQNTTNEIFRKIRELSYTENSFLYDRLRDDKFILLGHSYGAGCGLFMIGNECKWPFCSDNYSRPQELSGGIFYGISLKSPFGETYYKINNERIPVLLIAGDNDGAIKYEYAEKSFESIETNPKIFVRLKGANHYAINDINPPYGADADKNIQTLSQETGLGIISLLSAAFIKEYILESENNRGDFDRAASRYEEFIEVIKSTE